MKLHKIKVSAYINSVEKELLDFFKKKNIPITRQKTSQGNTHCYEVVLEREYFDDYEREIVKYCDDNQITYTFYRDEDGHHNYNFPNMIDRTEFKPKKTREYVEIEPFVEFDILMDKERWSEEKSIDIQKLGFENEEEMFNLAMGPFDEDGDPIGSYKSRKKRKIKQNKQFNCFEHRKKKGH
jgi:hypothetical protein